jgi:UDP-N-acetylmuramate--alanine ligase
MPGNHNVSNSLAAIAIARHLDIKEDSIKKSLSKFKGVNRRFTQVAELNGIKIIDDYGHHPVEISAVLSAARQTAKGKVFAIHQPHRYTRLNSLFEDFCSCFNEADFVGIMQVYSAGEAPIDGASRSDLVNGLVRHGHRNVFSVDSEDDLETLIRRQVKSGDIIVFLGAGTITVWANNLPHRLRDWG